MLNIVLIVILINFYSIIGDSDRPQQALKIQRFTSSVFSKKFPFFEKIPSCEWLNRVKFQKKLCSHRKHLPEILQIARISAVSECQQRFRYDQWNCSLREYGSRKLQRESAFMQAISASAVCFSVAKGCAEGKLSGCKCGEHGKSTPADNFKWAGCAYNTKFARKFTRKFLQIKKSPGDAHSAVMTHNAEVGIRTVLEQGVPACKCHGVSGSCSLKTCWMVLKPFNYTGEDLKMLYHKAVKVESGNSYRFAKGKNGRKLLYLDDSPNFCPKTVRRECKNVDNCATLCCGRGFYSQNVPKVEQCNCSWRYPYLLDCQKCTVNKTIFICT